MAEANQSNDKVLTREEVCEFLHISKSQVERFRRQGKLPYIKLAHKCVRYRLSDCEKLLNEYTVEKKGELN